MSSGAARVDAEARRLAAWQRITLATLLIGYTGYYVCRSNLSVGGSSIGAEFGLDKAALGNISAWGLVFYSFGKIFAGMACDFVGGRRVFLFGMAASTACTVLFALGPSLLPAVPVATLFVLLWSLNRLVQSPGWGALVKVSARWFPLQSHGKVMGILCLSYLFGDVVARAFLGGLLQAGFGWRGMFYVAAGTLAMISAASFVLLRASPRSIGAEEPAESPENLFAASQAEDHPGGVVALLLPFFTSPAFWMICAMSIGLTLIRESMLFWLPTYLEEVTGMRPGDAGSWSAIFPLFGGVSALVAGHLTDRWVGSRGRVMFPALALLVVPLALLAYVPQQSTPWMPLTCFSATAFLLLGPYTFLTGVLALDFGGKRGSSTAAGLVDGAGYFGAVVSTRYAGSVAESYGWDAVFQGAAIIAALTSLAALAYWMLDAAQRRRRARRPPVATTPAMAETAAPVG
ncbi:MAG: MFS transporter [Pirellulales bacterium]|nr:MFS transporter [Pirellulales bacterium]